MTNDPISLHRNAIEQLDAIVGRIDDADLDRPTPLEGMRLADLLAHEIGQHRGFAAAVSDGDAPASAYEPVPYGAQAWRDSVTAILEAFAGADLDARAREVELTSEPLPVRMIIGAQLLDTVIHTWDVARSLGQDWTPSDDLLAPVAEMAESLPPSAYGPGRAFGSRIEVSGDRWARTLGLVGRDPGWSGV